MLPTKPLLGVLADNLRRRQSVLPLSRRRAIGWANGLNIPMGGKTVIYTGLMYQLMPSILALEKMTSRLEDSPIRRLLGLGRMLNKVLSVSGFVGLWVSSKEQRIFDNILRNIACLLRTADIDFGYLYGEELYAGALVHDQGICSAFEDHAYRVYERLKQHGVKRVITVDPHTTNTLRTVYPKIIRDYRLEVTSYLELLAERNLQPTTRIDADAVIHDPCVYARYEGVVDEPRRLLTNAGVRALDPEYSAKMTFCCGGPIESLFPSKARSIAETRVQQLAAKGSHVVTMCPICFINLRAAAKVDGLSIEDISFSLAEGYCDRNMDRSHG